MPIPCRTPRVYIYISSSALEKPNTRTRRFGLGCGRRTSRRETTLSNHQTIPQARRARRPLRRRRARGYRVSPPSATRYRRLRAPASSARVIADVLLVGLVPHTPLSRAGRKRLYLRPALLLGVSRSEKPDPCSPMRSPCHLTTRTSLSLLKPPSNPRPLNTAPTCLPLLPQGSSYHPLVSATLTCRPHRHRLCSDSQQRIRSSSLASRRKWVPHGRRSSRCHLRLR